MKGFKAYRIHNEDGAIKAKFEQIDIDDLSPGEVIIRAAYSDVNYKDALAATGKGKILRTYPLVGGVDVAGEVVESTDPKFAPGDAVVVCGCELSETRDGGYAEFARVPAECTVALPAGLSLFEAMGIGTAGFTAALAVDRMEQMGQTPALGPIMVTGATGGVGSFAIDILAGRGYEVAALTDKQSAGEYLKKLGATQIVDRNGLDLGKRPLERAMWGGAVDNLGGDILTWLTRTVQPWGSIASIGLAQSHELHTTVMPFILRGVSLLGINSVTCSTSMRERAWQRLGGDMKPRHIGDIVTKVVPLDGLPDVFEAYIKGDVTGRTVVEINPQG